VLEGTLLLEIEGKPAVRLNKVLANYIVEKGKPVATPVP
jgi:hypothetical protein